MVVGPHQLHSFVILTRRRSALRLAFATIVLFGCGDDRAGGAGGADDVSVDTSADVARDVAIPDADDIGDPDGQADAPTDVANDPTGDVAGDAPADLRDLGSDGSESDVSEDSTEDSTDSGGKEDVTRPPAAMTVLTINLWNGALNPDADERLAIVGDAITAWQPDLVALQEAVTNDSIDNQVETLAVMTGYEHVYHQTHDVVIFEEGPGLLSRWPIVRTDVRDLPHVDLFIATRAVIAAEIDAPSGRVNFFATHMLVDPDQTRKADQAAAAVAFVDEFRGDLPGFYAGDLNAEPDTLAMRVMRGEAEHNGQAGDFLDAWTTTNPGMAGLTHPSDDPDKRIDYIYLVPGAAPMSPTSCEIVFDSPVDGLLPSDHLGVLCTFERE